MQPTLKPLLVLYPPIDFCKLYQTILRINEPRRYKWKVWYHLHPKQTLANSLHINSHLIPKLEIKMIKVISTILWKVLHSPLSLKITLLLDHNRLMDPTCWLLGVLQMLLTVWSKYSSLRTFTISHQPTVKREVAAGGDLQRASTIGEEAVVGLTAELFPMTKSMLLKGYLLDTAYNSTSVNGMWRPLSKSQIMKYGLLEKFVSTWTTCHIWNQHLTSIPEGFTFTAQKINSV